MLSATRGSGQTANYIASRHKIILPWTRVPAARPWLDRKNRHDRPRARV